MRIWKKFLALSLICMLVFSFAACDDGVIESEWDGLSNKIHQSTDGIAQETEPEPTDPNEILYGTWVKEMDISEAFIAGMEDSLDGLIEVPQMPFYVTLTMEFREDGTMSVSLGLDQESFGQFMEAFSDNMWVYVENMYRKMGLSGADLEAYCQDTFGVSVDVYMQELVEAMIAETAAKFPSVNLDMYYELEGTKLWIAENAEDLAQTADYITLSVSDGEMLVERLGGKEISSLQTAMAQCGEELPWTLLKK